MLFSTYLNESKNLKNEATLVLHKIIHMVDNGHVDMGEADIRFAVGPMVHKGSYDNLQVVIRKGSVKSVRLGRSKDGKGAFIVIETDKLPDRKGIDSMLEQTEFFNGFVEAFVLYLQKLHDMSAEYNKHDDEVEAENNENFEDNYNALIAEFAESNVKAYERAVGEVNDHIDNNANIIKKETRSLSVKKLQSEYLGTSEAEFLSVIKKLPTFKKFDRIKKELKVKLESRLKTYYKTSVRPLLGDE